MQHGIRRNKMNFTDKQRALIVNVLIAFAITLFDNFSERTRYMGDGSAVTGKKSPGPGPSYINWIQWAYYFILAIILVVLNPSRKIKLPYKILYTVIITVIFYCCMPMYSRRTGEFMILWYSNHFINPMLITKYSFIAIVSVLYGVIYDLMYQKQHIAFENQQLKNENLQTKYNMLANQISPHFLFNSLNSLSMLVRNKHNDRALQYIDKISDTFRYMLQSGQNDMTTLAQELTFAEAYMYLHMIRYENKLFFEVDVDKKYLEWKMPNMSLQPLIENAVKHNTITASKPFKIRVSNTSNNLVVTNTLIPKLQPSEGTGIGLKNLSSRYILLTGRDIKVLKSDTEFSVILPLIRP